jgi:hypothetical protein
MGVLKSLMNHVQTQIFYMLNPRLHYLKDVLNSVTISRRLVKVNF